MATSKYHTCPACRFPNLPGTLACLTCKTPLPGVGGDGEQTERLLLPPGGIDALRKERAARSAAREAAREAPLDAVADRLRRKTVAWLVCDPFDPVPLGAVPTLTIGRARDAGLVLPHTGVSRTHAVIRVLGRVVVLEDRSTFGTYVNGQRVSTRELATGDRIAIGPYELRVAPAMEGAEGDPDGTRQMKVSLVDPEATAMAGSLERVTAHEVLQGFEFHGRTGTFHVVTADGREGVVAIQDGRPMHARFGEAVDDEAVVALANLRAGQFRVLATVEPGAQTIRASLTELLLEASRRQDELERAR